MCFLGSLAISPIAAVSVLVFLRHHFFTLLFVRSQVPLFFSGNWVRHFPLFLPVPSTPHDLVNSFGDRCELFVFLQSGFFFGFPLFFSVGGFASHGHFLPLTKSPVLFWFGGFNPSRPEQVRKSIFLVFLYLPRDAARECFLAPRSFMHRIGFCTA